MIWFAFLGVMAATPTTPQYRLLGLTRDETAVAWHMQIERSHGGGLKDSYALIALMRCEGGGLIGLFRSGAIRRTDARGRTVKRSATQLANDNPMWQRALSAAQWSKLKRKLGLHKKALDMTDSALRLTPDAGIQVEAKSEGAEILIRAATGSALGYRPVARRWDSKHQTLGHFVAPAVEGGRWTASVRAHRGKGAYCVALHNRFVHDSGTVLEFVGVYDMQGSRLATQDLGTWQVMSEYRKGYRHDTFQLHPELEKDFNRLVGPGW